MNGRRALEIKSTKTIYKDIDGNAVNVAAFVLAPDGETVIGRFAKMEDALLDAAAPDLLEALQCAFLDGFYETATESYDCVPKGFVDKARAAINKAIGAA